MTLVDPRSVAQDLSRPLKARLEALRKKARRDPAAIRLRLPTIIAHLPCPRSARTPLPQLHIENTPYRVASAHIQGRSYRLLWPAPLRGCWPLRLIVFLQLVLDIALHLKADTRKHIPLPVSALFIARFFRPEAGRGEIQRVRQTLDTLATHPLVFITPDGRHIKLRLLLRTPSGSYVINGALAQQITCCDAFPHGLFGGPHVRFSLKTLQRPDRLALDHLLHLKARLYTGITRRNCIFAALRQLARQIVRWRNLKAALHYIHHLMHELRQTLQARLDGGRLIIPLPG